MSQQQNGGPAPCASVRFDLTASRTSIRVHIFRPRDGSVPRGLAVLFHGAGRHGLADRLPYLAAALASRGLVVYAWDAPFHGANSRDGAFYDAPTMIRDAVQVVRMAHGHADAPGGKLVLGGHSFGALLARIAAHRLTHDATGPQVDGVFLLAPTVRGPWHWALFRCLGAPLASLVAHRVVVSRANDDELVLHGRYPPSFHAMVHDCLHDDSTLSCPALLVAGLRDTMSNIHECLEVHRRNLTHPRRCLCVLDEAHYLVHASTAAVAEFCAALVSSQEGP